MRSFSKSDTTDRTTSGDSGPIETMGRSLWSLQSTAKSAGGAPTANVYLDGSNDGVTWTATPLLTQNHTGNGTKHGQVADVAYRFVRVRWDTFNNLTLDEYHLHGQGSANTD